MKTKIVIAAPLLAVVLGLSACSSTPTRNAALEEARAEFQRAGSDPKVVANAGQELARAREAMNRADEAWTVRQDETETKHAAYLAQQRARIALAVGEQRSNEQRMEKVTSERDQVRLSARTREADDAKTKAAIAQSQASAAQSQAAAAQSQASAADQQSQQARAQAQAARDAAQASRQSEQVAIARADTAQQQAQQQSERTAQLERALQELAAKKSDRGLVVTLQDVLFDVDRAELRSGALRSMDQIAAVLREYGERRVLIEGFTDSQGNDAYNLELSSRRASAARRALIERGVEARRIDVQPYGEAFPVATNASAEGRQMNRRLEIIFSDDAGSVKRR